MSEEAMPYGATMMFDADVRKSTIDAAGPDNTGAEIGPGGSSVPGRGGPAGGGLFVCPKALTASAKDTVSKQMVLLRFFIGFVVWFTVLRCSSEGGGVVGSVR